ncbi:MAG: oligosaccharide flippase family protein, partial [Gemmatimonadaceae bacterium]|nr:oligosaccharide flippase family protein [Gemmatimonadaceae bacterium]
SLQNRGLASLDLIRSVLQTVVVFVCALWGFGYWSLAIGQITASALGMLAMLFRVGIAPTWPSAEHWRASLVRGKHFMTTSVMWQSYSNADIWVLSRVVGPAAVGAYSLARTLASMPSDKIVTVVTGVTNGYVANAKSDSAALKRLYLALTHGVAIITALPLAGLAATADLAVPVLLGERWVDVVAPLRFLCVGAFLWSLNTVAFQVAANAEKIRGLSISSAAAVPFSYAAYFVAARFGGASFVAAAWIVVVVFVALPVIALANKTSQASLREYLLAHADAVKVIVIVFASTYAVRWVIPHAWPPQLSLAALAFVGGLAGGLVIWRSPMPSVVALKSKLLRRAAA